MQYLAFNYLEMILNAFKVYLKSTKKIIKNYYFSDGIWKYFNSSDWVCQAEILIPEVIERYFNKIMSLYSTLVITLQ